MGQCTKMEQCSILVQWPIMDHPHGATHGKQGISPRKVRPMSNKDKHVRFISEYKGAHTLEAIRKAARKEANKRIKVLLVDRYEQQMDEYALGELGLDEVVDFASVPSPVVVETDETDETDDA